MGSSRYNNDVLGFIKGGECLHQWSDHEPLKASVTLSQNAANVRV
jgi:hypothetical protein